MKAVDMLRAVVALGRTRWWNHNRSGDDVAVGQGASTDDIRFHCDLSRNFYRLWLDETMKQKAFVDDKRIQGIDVRLASWAELQDTAAFDAVIPIGAMEHFAQPGLTSDEKTAIYRGFFKKVRQALKPGGWLSLQINV